MLFNRLFTFFLLVLAASFSTLAQSCNISNFEVYGNQNACDTFWTMDGVVEFQNPPATGDLIFEDCAGNISVLASAPFTSPINYSGITGPITSLTASNCNFEVYFSAQPTCLNSDSILFPATAPPEEAGTVTPNLTGEGINNYILCDGDVLTINSNDDYNIQSTNPADNPSLIYFVYTCPPSPGGIGINPAADPCFQNYFTSEDITLTNNGGSADPLIQALGNPTDNIFYIVPMTAVNVVGNNITITQDCYDLALDQMVTVQYLNPIVTSLTESCSTGEAIINIQGGYTELYPGPGSQNIVSNIQPPSLTFNGTFIDNNGNLILEFLTEGLAYSFDITGANGCTTSFSSTFITPDDASFTYPNNSFCVTDIDPSPTVTGVNGGTFSSTPGLTLDPVSGTVDLSTSLPGNYTVTYQTPPSICSGIETFAIVVNDLPLLSPSNSGPICIGQAVNLSASNAVSYTWDNGLGVGQNQTVSPTVTTAYTVTATDINGCSNSATTTVLVNPLPIVDAGTDIAVCSGNLATLNGSGALTYVWDNAVSNGVPFAPLVTNTYTVTGTDNNSCSNTDQVVVTVNDLPVVSVGADQSVCENSSVVLSASGTPTISWDNGVTNNTSFVPNIGTTTYTATGTDANGCSNTASVNITVNPNPVVTILGNTSYCQGTSASLQVNTTAVSYVWSSGGNLQTETVTTADNPISVTITDANGCNATSAALSVTELLPVTTNNNIEICQGQTATIHGNIETVDGTYTQVFPDVNGCDSTSNVVLTVNPLPIVNAGADFTICENTPITLTGSGVLLLSWDNGVVDNVPFLPPLGVTTYTLTGTDANGCSNTSSLDVTVLQNPFVDAGADLLVCDGEQVVLSALTPDPSTVLTWDNGVQNSIAFTPSIGVLNYQVTAIDINGCSSSDDVQVAVSPLPTVDAGANQIVCEGESTTLNASGATTYIWNNGVSNGVPFSPTQDTFYVVTGTTPLGCSSSDSVFIAIENLNQVSFSANEVQGCAPLNVVFTGTDIPNSTCLWDFGNGFTSTSCTSSSAVFLNTGCYDISYTSISQNGCESTATLIDYVCVDESPTALFSSSTNQISLDASEVSFFNNSTGASSYSWDFSGQGTSTSLNPSFEFTIDDVTQFEINLTAISDLGCTDTFTLLINSVEELLFYVPNSFTPDGNELNNLFLPIFTQGFDAFDYNLLIFNRWGEVVFESNNPTVGWDGTYGMDGGSIVKTGTYVWKIEFKTDQSDERKLSTGHVNVLR
jgi:gliding motility-associated-like protein